MARPPMTPCPKPQRQPKRAKSGFGRGQRAQRSGGHLFPRNVSVARRRFIRAQRCVATGRKTGEVVTAQPWMSPSLRALCPYVARVVVAHVKSRGSSGKDAENMIPLEAQLHRWLGDIGQASFERRVHLMPLGEIALEYERKFQVRAAAITKNRERSL